MAGLPVDQHLGNLEGKDMRFGTSAGAVYAAITTDVTSGAVNAEMDSLNPAAAISPMVGMWLNCIFGGKGVGMINMLMFVIIGIFIAGMMVGRTPEYLGKKIGAREVKLAVIALLVHPLMILAPSGLYAATGLGPEGDQQRGAPRALADRLSVLLGLREQRLGLRRPGRHVRLLQQPEPGAHGRGLGHRRDIVIAISRFLPIIAMVAMAAYLGEKKSAPQDWARSGTTRERSASCCSARSSSSAPCCSCPSRSSARWPSIWGRYRSAAER